MMATDAQRMVGAPPFLDDLSSHGHMHLFQAQHPGTLGGINGPKRVLIVNRQLCHWFRCDPKLGAAIAKGLNVDVDAVMAQMKHDAVTVWVSP